MAVALGLAVVSGCAKDKTPATADATVVDSIADSAAADLGAADSGLADAGPTKPGDPVAVDLAPHSGAGKATGAWARKITDAKDLIGGPAAQGKIGDFTIGNGSVRYIVQGDDRHQGPCPWGGTLLDADIVRPAGEPGQDNVGEYCLLFHLGRTIKPDKIEVLSDGSQGGAAVLAVTGHDTENDFIHLTGLIATFVGSAIELPLDTDQDLPLTITRYYVMRPDSPVLRVVTAMRNDGTAPIVTHIGELADSGGGVEFFNPLSSKAGFGYGGFGAEAMDFLAFRGKDSSHLLSPQPATNDGPGGAYLSVSGVAGMLFGTTDLLGLLLTPKADFASKAGAVALQGGKVFAWSHDHVVGSGDLSTLTGPLWAVRGLLTGTITGKAVDPDGKPVAAARISAIAAGTPPRAMTQFVSASDGTFGGAVPAGAYTFAGDASGRSLVKAANATVVVGKTVDAGAVTFSVAGSLAITVKDSAGQPCPAKVTVVCADKCPVPQTSLHRDVSFDKKPDNLDSDGDGKPDAAIADIAFVPPSGSLNLPLAPGNYLVTVSRGPVWSLWPPDAGAVKGGFAVTVKAGAAAAVDAQLAKVIDTSGHLNGDFHVHAINSPDAPVPNLERVYSMAAEGVEIMVSTDHDFVTDFGPVVAAAKADKVLASVPGVELTTFDYGHYNGFPMPVKADDVNGGAPDWGLGEGPGMTPQQIAQALGAPDPARVAQINHPEGGYLKAIEFDALTGISKADPTKFRMPPMTPDPKTGDTKLFTTQFTAIELLNGYGIGKFNSVASWWMPLLSCGVRFTGTGVSDTHNWTSSQSGGPRSWVRVGAGKDVITGFDIKHFALQVNAGKVVGTNGPFVRVRATTEGNAAIAEVGDTLQLPVGIGLPALVTIEVEIQAPQWMPFDSIELHRDVTNTAPAPGEVNSQAPTPRQKVTFALQASDLHASADGSPLAKRWIKKVILHELVAKDAWLVIYVNGQQKLPVALVSGRAAQPFAFTNPIYIDANGAGYDQTALPKHAAAAAGKGGLEQLPWPKSQPKRAPTWADYYKLRRAAECGHDEH